MLNWQMSADWRLVNTSAVVLGGLVVSVYVYRVTKKYYNKRRLHQLIKQQREQRDQSITLIGKQLQKTPPAVRRRIQELSFSEVLESLQQREYTAVQVLHAYQETAIKAHEQCNCLTEFILEAESWAESMDQLDQETIIQSKSLFGLPFSVKEELAIEGYKSTWGMAQNLHDAKTETNQMVRVLRDQLGAIPFVRTNVPQTLASASCSNPIYGRTRNPWNKHRVPGGSSGGDAALIALKGCAFGIGSDIGGSVRIPASFCGVAGFKPTVERFSQYNTYDEQQAHALIASSFGIQALDALSLQTIIHELFGADIHMMDPYVVHNNRAIPQPPTATKTICECQQAPLRIGYMLDDPDCVSMPVCARAVTQAVDRLTQAGHNVVPFQMPQMQKALCALNAAAFMDNGLALRQALDLDIEEPDEVFNYRLYGLNKLHRRLRLLGHSARVRQPYEWLCSSANDLRQIYIFIRQYRKQIVRDWKAANIQVLLCPVSATVAPKHGQASQMWGCFSYAGVFNVLNFPAMVVKGTKVTEEDIRQTEQRDWGHDLLDRHLREANAHMSCLGLPVGVQIAALPFEDELVLQVGALIEQLTQ